MQRYNKIAYLTVIPFKDTGNLAEYFIKNSKEFYLYLFPPSYKNQPTQVSHYRNGKLIKKEELWWYKGNNKALIHVFYYIYYLHVLIKYRITNTFIIFYFPLYLFLNSIISLFTGNKFVFWIWDYFPTKSNVMNIYNALVKHYNDSLRYVLYLSPNLKKIYTVDNVGTSKVREVVSFGIKKVNVDAKPVKNTVGYIGNLRPGQGLEFILEAAKQNPKLRVEFAGDGPLREELEKFVNRYKLSKRVVFHGFVTNEQLLQIVKSWEAAVAPYIPSKDNPTMYTEPGKIKLYIELGLPVIMTKVSYIYKDLIKYNAGIAIAYTYKSFAEGLSDIQKKYKHYKAGVEQFKKDNQFETYYQKKFAFLEHNEKKA